MVRASRNSLAPQSATGVSHFFVATMNELSSATLYYHFFLNQQQNDVVISPDGTQKQEGESWIEDTWTELDEQNAAALLASHLEMSTISSLESQNYMERDSNEWDKFYQDNGTRFFKDRHYFHKDFPNEFGPSQQLTVLPNNNNNNEQQLPTKTLVEIGCGVGNACLPLLEDEKSPWKTIHAMDISKEAIALLRQEERFVACNASVDNNGRSIHGHVCDISSESFPGPCVGVADVTTLIFCLSALDPDDMPRAAKHVASSLKPGGVLVFRDYGRYDEAQLKLGTSRNKRIKENFYRKHDGTKCYYFSLEDVDRLFREEGLETLELKYLRRAYSNKASGERRRRVWVQARFIKPK